MQEMQKMSGRQFCPDCVEAFIKVLKSSGVADGIGADAPTSPSEHAAAPRGVANGERTTATISEFPEPAP